MTSPLTTFFCRVKPPTSFHMNFESMIINLSLGQVYFKFAHEGHALEKVEWNAQHQELLHQSIVIDSLSTWQAIVWFESFPVFCHLCLKGSMAKKLRLVTSAIPLRKWRSFQRHWFLPSNDMKTYHNYIRLYHDLGICIGTFIITL